MFISIWLSIMIELMRYIKLIKMYINLINVKNLQLD